MDAQETMYPTDTTGAVRGIDTPVSREVRRGSGERKGGRAPYAASRAATDSPAAADRYLQELSALPLLSREDEIELGHRIEKLDKKFLQLASQSSVARAEALSLLDQVRCGERPDEDLVLNPEQSNAVDIASATALLEAIATDPLRAEKRIDGTSAQLSPLVFNRILTATGREGGDLAVQLAALREEVAAQRRHLVEGNLRLVVFLARKHLGRGVPLLDLVQEGNLGLIRAAAKFDYRRGFRFTTYASWWVKQSLDRCVLEKRQTIRVPLRVAGARRRLLRARQIWANKHGREPTVAELAEKSGMSADQVDAMLNVVAEPASLDAPMGREQDARLSDFIPTTEVGAEEIFARNHLRAQLHDVIATLAPREQEILALRFGLNGKSEHTLDEIGAQFSLTRERIRQIEVRALEKLRARSVKEELESYLR